MHGKMKSNLWPDWWCRPSSCPRVSLCRLSPYHCSWSSPDKQLTVSIPGTPHGVGLRLSRCKHASASSSGAAYQRARKSFVITLFDGDVHVPPSGWWHWVLDDVPANVTRLLMGNRFGNICPLCLLGWLKHARDLGTEAYHGPCPDKGVICSITTPQAHRTPSVL